MYWDFWFICKYLFEKLKLVYSHYSVQQCVQ